MSELTPKESRIFRYISETLKSEGYAPSVRDIQNALNIRSTSTVHSYLAKLEQKGYIHKEQGKSRTLRVDNGGAGGTNASGAVKVPLLGRVAAGVPILAVENLEGYIDLPLSGLSRSSRGAELFALRVAGESMIGDGIMDGDIVIVRKENFAENGNLVVALVEDEATVKRIYKENGRFRLQPSNPAMEPIYAEEVYVLGRVIANIRYYA